MNWRLLLLFVLLASPGVLAVAWLSLPLLVDPRAQPVPLEALQLASAVQGILLAAVASAVGVLLAARVGLRAPAMWALVERRDVAGALRPQLVPGAVGGLLGAALILAFHAFSPDALSTALGEQRAPLAPLAVRVLYGGITEEVLMRWGAMSFIAWTLWRILQRGSGPVSAELMWLSIALSAVLFGLGHLPSVAASMATVPLSVVAYVTIGNALFGTVAGYLYWRYGLEAAIVAHVLAHLLAYAIRG